MIADGKLAVVLGIEVDNLFNCHWNDRRRHRGDCTPDGIRQKVQEYYDLGVRHIFPIHNFNNAYGGPATWAGRDRRRQPRVRKGIGRSPTSG